MVIVYPIYPHLIRCYHPIRIPIIINIEGANSMISVEHSITIEKPVEEVYAYTNDPDNTSSWQGGVVSVKYPEGPLSKGTQFVEVRRFMGRDMETTVEVTAHELNKSYGAKALSGPIPFEVSVTYESVGSGTKMITLVEAEPGGFFKLAEGAVSKQLKKSLQEDAERLKSILES
jgi:uncharacterized membrane protein